MKMSRTLTRLILLKGYNKILNNRIKFMNDPKVFLNRNQISNWNMVEASKLPQINNNKRLNRLNQEKLLNRLMILEILKKKIKSKKQNN